MKRLVGEGVGGLEPFGIDLVIDAELERLGEDHGIVKPSGDRLQLGDDRGLLGSAPQFHRHLAFVRRAGARRAGSASAPGRFRAWSTQSTASA